MINTGDIAKHYTAIHYCSHNECPYSPPVDTLQQSLHDTEQNVLLLLSFPVNKGSVRGSKWFKLVETYRYATQLEITNAMQTHTLCSRQM